MNIWLACHLQCYHSYKKHWLIISTYTMVNKIWLWHNKQSSCHGLTKPRSETVRTDLWIEIFNFTIQVTDWHDMTRVLSHQIKNHSYLKLRCKKETKKREEMNHKPLHLQCTINNTLCAHCVSIFFHIQCMYTHPKNTILMN